MKNKAVVFAKGFCMGMADIVPGVSGGTVAFITGIYDRLIASISSFDGVFLQHLLGMRWKAAADHIQLSFLIPLFVGIFSALISMSNLMHYCMDNFPIYTWALFFGLILASIVYVAKQVEEIKTLKSFGLIAIGTAIGYMVIKLVPVDMPDTGLFVFLAGCISICAMILPGISGSFILLILGKYFYVTSAIKNPFADGSIVIIVTFGAGAAFGLLSFSKLLNYFLRNFHGPMMCVLVGFMIGSLQKIWPWREVVNSKMIGGKRRILEEVVFFPPDFNQQVIIAFVIMFIAAAMVFAVEKLSQKPK